MSFREKRAWVLLTGIVAMAALYFGSVFSPIGGTGGRGVAAVGMLIIAIVVQIVISAVGIALLAISAPNEAGRPMDERERLIELRASGLAYIVLIVGALAAIASIHLGADRFAIVNAVFAAVVAAEIVHYAVFLAFTRRGA